MSFIFSQMLFCTLLPSPLEQSSILSCLSTWWPQAQHCQTSGLLLTRKGLFLSTSIAFLSLYALLLELFLLLPSHFVLSTLDPATCLCCLSPWDCGSLNLGSFTCWILTWIILGPQGMSVLNNRFSQYYPSPPNGGGEGVGRLSTPDLSWERSQLSQQYL